MDVFIPLSINLTKVILALLLTFASLTKIVTSIQPNEVTKQYGGRNTYTIFVNLFLPAIEMSIAVTLLLPNYSHIASLASALLFAIFFVNNILNLIRKNKMPCGCFGQFSTKSTDWITATQTGLFFVAALVLTLTAWQVAKIDEHLFGAVIAGGFLTAVIGVILTFSSIQIPSNTVRINHYKSEASPNRREVLKGIGATILGIIAIGLWQKPVEASSCCKCQTYDHFDPGCCPSPVESRLHHFFKRCCNSCTGGNGYWHLQWETCDYQCFCAPYDEWCDVIHACTGSDCYCTECCTQCPS